jgi:hypothetical protein
MQNLNRKKKKKKRKKKKKVFHYKKMNVNFFLNRKMNVKFK